MNKAQLAHAILEAKEAAYAAADDYFKTRLGGVDQYSCGFAWVTLYDLNGKKLDGRSRVAKDLQDLGVRKAYGGGFQLWNPSGYGCQNIDTLEAGARAAADVFKKYGFKAYAGSRLD